MKAILEYEDLWEIVGESERKRPKEKPKTDKTPEPEKPTEGTAEKEADEDAETALEASDDGSDESKLRKRQHVWDRKDKKSKGLIILNTYHLRMTQMCLKTYRPTNRVKVAFSHLQKKPFLRQDSNQSPFSMVLRGNNRSRYVPPASLHMHNTLQRKRNSRTSDTPQPLQLNQEYR
ncbi:hypothetical protein RUND412_004132 [Rhizina undulata]